MKSHATYQPFSAAPSIPLTNQIANLFFIFWYCFGNLSVLFTILLRLPHSFVIRFWFFIQFLITFWNFFQFGEQTLVSLLTKLRNEKSICENVYFLYECAEGFSFFGKTWTYAWIWVTVKLEYSMSNTHSTQFGFMKTVVCIHQGKPPTTFDEMHALHSKCSKWYWYFDSLRFFQKYCI